MDDYKEGRKYNLNMCLDIKENQNICEKHFSATLDFHWDLKILIIVFKKFLQASFGFSF